MVTRIIIIKKQTITNVGKNEEKQEVSYIAGRNIKWGNYFGKQLGRYSKNLSLRLPCDLAVQSLGL